MTALQRQFLLAVADCETIQAGSHLIWSCMKDRCAKAKIDASHDDFCSLWAWADAEGMMLEQPRVMCVSSKGARALQGSPA